MYRGSLLFDADILLYTMFYVSTRVPSHFTCANNRNVDRETKSLPCSCIFLLIDIGCDRVGSWKKLQPSKNWRLVAEKLQTKKWIPYDSRVEFGQGSDDNPASLNITVHGFPKRDRSGLILLSYMEIATGQWNSLRTRECWTTWIANASTSAIENTMVDEQCRVAQVRQSG